MSGAEFDAIVIGGGPAGSLTAYYLASAGIRTALFDASSFPRPKPCGGGLQARTLVDLPFDLTHLFRRTMNRVSLSFRLRDSWTREYPLPLVYGVRRTEFDHYLLERARSAGVTVHESSPVRSFEASGDGPVTVRIDRGEFRAQCLIGADGANSVVRTFLNQRHQYFWQAAVYCEVPDEWLNDGVVKPNCMFIDWGTLPSGYAWMFPKDDHVNIGAGGPVSIAKHLKRYVTNFIAKRRLLKGNTPDRLTLIGHQLPTHTLQARLAARRVLLVGDAAGLVEPLTGDGISFACQSAKLASRCIFRALNSGRLDLSEYHSLLTAEIGKELQWSRKLLSVSASFPRLIHSVFKSNDRVWQTFCKILRGEDSFEQLKKDILGPFEFAWKPIDLFVRSRERSIFRQNAIATQLKALV
ncbi:MAG TPA: geranylgeranyl reductase family protein [Bryobacteraceae bacterium]|nr:geranylgeranyl reductase family protein [Bryobacteraceae bacterium]